MWRQIRLDQVNEIGASGWWRRRPPGLTAMTDRMRWIAAAEIREGIALTDQPRQLRQRIAVRPRGLARRAHGLVVVWNVAMVLVSFRHLSCPSSEATDLSDA